MNVAQTHFIWLNHFMEFSLIVWKEMFPSATLLIWPRKWKKNSEHSPNKHTGKVWKELNENPFQLMSGNLRFDPFLAHHGAKHLRDNAQRKPLFRRTDRRTDADQRYVPIPIHRWEQLGYTQSLLN